MTERRGVPPPPKAESERVAKLIGQQRRQVNHQSDESLQKQKIMFSYFAYSNFFTAACLAIKSIHCQWKLEAFGIILTSLCSYMAKRLVCFSQLIACWSFLLYISLPFLILHHWLYLQSQQYTYICIEMLHVETMIF